MKTSANPPSRAETLNVLLLMGMHAKIMMLSGSDDDYGSRWILHGQQIQPGIVKYLMDHGLIAEDGKTDFGARLLGLTAQGIKFREDGVSWWDSLSLFQKLKIRLFG